MRTEVFVGLFSLVALAGCDGSIGGTGGFEPNTPGCEERGDCVNPPGCEEYADCPTPGCEERGDCPTPQVDRRSFPTFNMAPEGIEARPGISRLTLEQVELSWERATGVRPDFSTLPNAESLSESRYFDNLGLMLALTQVAEDLVAGMHVSDELNVYFPCNATPCVPNEIRSFLERVFVRSIDDDTLAPYVETYDEGRMALDADREPYGGNFGRRAVIRSALLSPYLLYRTEIGDGSTLSAHELAEKLSFVLWNSPPDDELVEHANDGSLLDPMVRARQVDRMLMDQRARVGVRRLIRSWLAIDVDWNSKPSYLELDDGPGFASSLEEEFRLLVDYIVFEKQGNVRDLFTTAETFVDARLADHYGLSGPSGDEFERVALPPETERRGLLTTGLVIASHTKEGGRSPMQQGAFIVQDVLCYSFPTGAVVGVLPAELEDLPMREAFQGLADGAGGSCINCHRMMNVGFALDLFDNLGRRNPLIDSAEAAASIEFRPTPVFTFDGTIDAIEGLAVRQEVGRCVSGHLIEMAQGSEPSAADEALFDALAAITESDEGSVLEMFRTLLVSERFAASVQR